VVCERNASALLATFAPAVGLLESERQMMPGDNDGRRLPALDGWRGIAILLVLFDHVREGSGGLLHKISRTGATGVGLFFALSGFLITTRLLQEHAKFGRVNLLHFYLRRGFRLIPASLTYLLALCGLASVGMLTLTAQQFAASLLFFRNYIPMDIGGSGWFTGHFWSLAVEEHFYLLWPALLVRTKGKPVIPAVLACLVGSWRYIDLHYHVVHTHLWFPGRSDVRMDGLLWGCVLAILLSQPSFRQKLRDAYPLWLLLIFCAVDIGSNVLSGKHNYSPYEPLLLALILVWPVLYPRSWLATLLDLAPLRWLGALSYSIYIWQELWLVFPGVPSGLRSFQFFPWNLLCAFACAILSYYFIEKPMINFGHRLTSNHIAPSRLAALENSAA
jgi:peptidoglycan/LPS O-acetylase OafA/YrhL